MESLEARIGITTAGAALGSPGGVELWPKASLSFQAAVLPSAPARFCQALTSRTAASLLRAHAGNGILGGHFPGVETQEQAAAGS